MEADSTNGGRNQDDVLLSNSKPPTKPSKDVGSSATPRSKLSKAPVAPRPTLEPRPQRSIRPVKIFCAGEPTSTVQNSVCSSGNSVKRAASVKAPPKRRGRNATKGWSNLKACTSGRFSDLPPRPGTPPPLEPLNKPIYYLFRIFLCSKCLIRPNFTLIHMIMKGIDRFLALLTEGPLFSGCAQRHNTVRVQDLGKRQHLIRVGLLDFPQLQRAVPNLVQAQQIGKVY